jgi:protein-glutamine gamma-glutamyltransferase
MADLSQFRPTLYFLLALGITGFALAAQSPPLWVLSMGAMGLNVWLIHTGRFVPLSRLTATAITILALFFVARELRTDQTPILVVGDFLVLLHLVKLYEQRANRDYAQLLVLSLLLMAAAAISTASLLFGLMLVVYLLVSLYCCLLFHLKVESEAAQVLLAKALPPAHRTPVKVNPNALRQDQRRLSVSMRRLTALVSIFAIGMGVIVFLFFPRGAGEELLGRRFWTPPQATGLTDTVSLDQVAQINQLNQMVAAVKVTRDGKPWGGAEPLILRALTLDEYTGDGGGEQGMRPWQWVRGATEDPRDVGGAANRFRALPATGEVDAAGAYVQEIDLQPTGSSALPALAGLFAIQTTQNIKLAFYPRDGSLINPINDNIDEPQSLKYIVKSTGKLPVTRRFWKSYSRINPQLASFARLPEVSGVDNAGRPFAELYGTSQAPPDIDHRIAISIEHYLRSNYQYTLDLTDARDLMEGRDPLVAFLTTVKRGHCEYFAGAMTLMCQSLGMQARMVVGYHCDLYNSVGQIYIVLQSQAHAWVEVLTDQGWETFDPTSSNEAMTADSVGFFGRLKSLFNYLQYQWGTAVVAYGQENRQNIMNAINLSITQTAVRSSQSMHTIPGFLSNLEDELSAIIDNPTPISILAAGMIITMVGMVGYYAYEQYRLRRRASRIGLGDLPNAQRQRLARQLGFYDNLLRLMERRGLTPRPHWTPLEFSDELAFLPPQAYHDIRRLTRLFYRVRYGRLELNARRRRRLDNAIVRIDQILRRAAM